MPFADSNCTSIYYEVHGEDGSPLILINGYATSIAFWSSDMIQTLSGAHRTIVVDNRGMGRSDKPKPPYSMAQFAADTVAVLDALAIDRVHVCGHSMGGIIAQWVAWQHPSRLLSLTLASTTATDFVTEHILPPEDAMAEIAADSSLNRVDQLRQGWKYNVTPEFLAANRDLLERRLQASLAYAEPSAQGLEGQWQAILANIQSGSAPGRLDQVECPTLVITGREDVLVPAKNSRIMADTIPNADLVELAHCGHELNVERSRAFEAHILAFLHSVDQRRIT